MKTPDSMNNRHAPVIFFILVFAGILIALWLVPEPDPEKVAVTRMDLQDDPREKKVHAGWMQELDLLRFQERDGGYWQVTSSGIQVESTLDASLQNFLLEEFRRYELPYAAAVLIRLPDGEVRAMTGYSHAEPRLTYGELTLKAWAPAASLAKVVSAAALLTTPGYNPDTAVCYSGGRTGIQARHIDGPVPENAPCENLETALAHSTNAVMGRLAREHLTSRHLLGVAEVLGFNQSLPFEFPVERSRFRIQETDPMALPLAAAGFGHMTISPWHAAWLAATVARNGQPPPVHFIRSARDADNQPLELQRPASLLTAGLPEEVMSRLRVMMLRTVTEGTAREGFYRKDQVLVPVTVGGKTGTLGRRDPEPLLYTWFIGYAPVEEPRFAFSVIVVTPERWRTKASFVSARLVNRVIAREETSQ